MPSLDKLDWPCTKPADAGKSLPNKVLLLLLSSLCSTLSQRKHAVYSMSNEVSSAVLPRHQCSICSRRCRIGDDMHAGQNGTTTAFLSAGFGAAAHTNGTQDEDEQTEPEEAVRDFVAGFTLLDISYSCCTGISFIELCSKIAKVDVETEHFCRWHHASPYVAAWKAAFTQHLWHLKLLGPPCGDSSASPFKQHYLRESETY